MFINIYNSLNIEIVSKFSGVLGKFLKILKS
jgi:hypothetical protein